MSKTKHEELLRALKARFEKNMNRHKGLDWAGVQARLDAGRDKLQSLEEMERTGGEPERSAFSFVSFLLCVPCVCAVVNRQTPRQ